MHPGPNSAGNRADEGLTERVEGIAGWITDLDARVRATELATGDEKAAKELRRAVEALSKHDPKLEKRLTNRVDVLADRLSTLASTVSTTAAALARKDGEIAALKRELEGGNKRIEALVREYGRAVGAEEVEKLRAAIRAVAVERPAPPSARLDDLGGKVDYLTERVDTLAKTVATTAAGLTGREGEIAGLRQRLDEGSAEIERMVAELRLVQGDDALAERLEALQTAVGATTTGLAQRESEIAAVRARIDEAYARVGSVVSDLQQSISGLSSQVAALEELPRTTERALEERSAELSRRVDGVAGRLDSLAGDVESALTGLAGKEQEVSALNRHVDDASSRVDAVVAELRQALAELPAPGSIDPVLEERLQELSGVVVAVTDQLAELETASSRRVEDTASRTAALEQLLAEVGERLDTVERDRDAATEKLTRADAKWSEERVSVRRELEALAAAHADASQAHEGLAPLLDELAVRLDAMERDRAAVTAEITRVSEALDTQRTSLQAQLDGLAAALAEAAAASEGDGPERLAELAVRLDSVEQGGAAVASEVARTTAFWAVELESLEARLDEATSANDEGVSAGPDEETERLLGEVTGRLDALERDRQAVAAEITRISDGWAAGWAAERSSLEGRLDEVAAHVAEVASDARGATATSPSADEVAQLRALVDGFRMRLASSEQELATLVSARDVGSRLDELTRRLESLERAPLVVTAAGDGPIAGDGRFRLELRALELRMEHAEAAARENREAVLVQLERLAARIEWRFQRLEAEHDSRYPQAVGEGAKVVPIRPVDA